MLFLCVQRERYIYVNSSSCIGTEKKKKSYRKTDKKRLCLLLPKSYLNRSTSLLPRAVLTQSLNRGAPCWSSSRTGKPWEKEEERFAKKVYSLHPSRRILQKVPCFESRVLDTKECGAMFPACNRHVVFLHFTTQFQLSFCLFTI